MSDLPVFDVRPSAVGGPSAELVRRWALALGAMQMILKHEQIRKICVVAIELKLEEQRGALLTGMPQSLCANFNQRSRKAAELLEILDALNQLPLPTGPEASPLEHWLSTALLLTKHDPRHEEFKNALDEIEKIRKKSAPPKPLKSTSLVLDRLDEWNRVITDCNTRAEHLVFLVHGNNQSAPEAFARRIGRYLASNVKDKCHVTHLIEGQHDGDRAMTAEAWQRRIVDATERGEGELGPALESNTNQYNALFVLLDNDGPFNESDTDSQRALLDFFGERLPNAVGSERRNFRHQLRFVIPIAYSGEGTLNTLVRKASRITKTRAIEKLESVIQVSKALKPVNLELHIPTWKDVESWLKDWSKKNHRDSIPLKECKATYEKYKDQGVVELGDQLHKVIYGD